MRRTGICLSLFAALVFAGCGDSSPTNPNPTFDTGGGGGGYLDTGGTFDSYVFPDSGGGGGRLDTGGGGGRLDTGGGGGRQDSGGGGGRQDAPPPKPAATCGGTAKLVIQEVAVGGTDYVVLKNTGSSPVAVAGFKLLMYGIQGSTAVEHTFTAASVAAGALLYVFEYSTGKQAGDVNTGKNIPFYNGPPSATRENAVALLDGSGNMLDYWAVGSNAVGRPSNVTFQPMQWDSSFDSSKSSFQRKGNTGSCPNFTASDWGTGALTRN